MLKLEIEHRAGSPPQEGRPQGIIGEIPAENGEYELNTGDIVFVEMNPPEAESVGQALWVVALTSSLFEGHMRGAGYRGKARRVVQIGKKGEGSTNLSSYEILRVTVSNALKAE